MTQLVFTEEELMRSHEYARPQEIDGHRLHGGFDREGHYVPPRCLVRNVAIENWSRALADRGGQMLKDTAFLLDGIRYPNAEQMKFLISEGLGQNFWNMLTIIGKIEGKGRLLAEFPIPDFQDVIVEDVSEMGIGHLHKGLLKAHGMDEGGEPEKGIGGHDVMWFALRDLAFGVNAYPDVAPPERIMRPEDENPPERPIIEADHQGILTMLLNLLLIEFRAELGFQFSETLLRDSDLFVDRRDGAEEAARIVGRIRADEEIHVTSLRLFFGEFRSVTFKRVDGSTISGAELVDPLWRDIVNWAVHEQPELAARQERELLKTRIYEQHAQADRVFQKFEALAGAA